LRHTELNTDIVTWTRLINRSTPSVGLPNDSSSPAPMAVVPEARSKQNSGGHGDSPPSSPLTSHSGESTPKSPNTPNNLEREEGPPVNGELPPPIPINEDDLAPTSRINDHPIIPPPREFLGSAEDLARRRASEGSVVHSPIGHAPAYMYSEGVNPMSPNRHQHHHNLPHNQYPQQSPQHSSNMATGREVRSASQSLICRHVRKCRSLRPSG
jgi:hypothetical protein